MAISCYLDVQCSQIRFFTQLQCDQTLDFLSISEEIATGLKALAMTYGIVSAYEQTKTSPFVWEGLHNYPLLVG